jgi:crotonobetainyl-CoA:carnitine CoA-transferase CaiB-like acyl-CoA transferase
MVGLLDGMRVLDVSVWRPMPHATQILADLGAEVLKLEPPGGDPMRAYPEIFASIARGKRSVMIDLKSDDGKQRALELAADADVLCEGFRPGVVDRLGIGYDAVLGVNPSVIYCSLSGFGQTGPWRDVSGHDAVYQAVAGALAPRGNEVPQIPRLPAADLEGGTMAALLICAAWARRVATGEGERIDMSMTDAVAWWVGPNSGVKVESPDASTGEAPDDEDGDRPGGSPGYGVFPTVDGGYIATAVLTEDHFWDGICRVLKLDDLIGEPFAKRLANLQEWNDRIAAAIAQRPRDELIEQLHAVGAPASPVLTPEEMAEHPQLLAREMIVDAGGARAMATPAMLANHPRRNDGSVPAPGEHDGFTPRD